MISVSVGAHLKTPKKIVSEFLQECQKEGILGEGTLSILCILTLEDVINFFEDTFYFPDFRVVYLSEDISIMMDDSELFVDLGIDHRGYPFMNGYIEYIDSELKLNKIRFDDVKFSVNDPNLILIKNLLNKNPP